MTFVHPFADRKRRTDDKSPLEDGEYVGFDMAFMDAARASGSTFLTDADLDRAVRAAVDREQALHDHKFAFMGNLAPKFDRANAEFLARNRLMTDAQASTERSRALASARHQEAAYQASKAALNSHRGGTYAAHHQDAAANAASLRDAMRFSRYGGE